MRPHDPATIPARFWKKVAKSAQPAGCWLWKGSLYSDGYGQFKINPTTNRRAHRVAWELTYGHIPDGLWVLHNCPDGDNPQCVNPAHLWLGTALENSTDMLTKDRGSTGTRNGAHTKPESRRRGELNGRSVLTVADVQSIRTCYAEGPLNSHDLAEIYNVSQAMICKICRRVSWAHVP